MCIEHDGCRCARLLLSLAATRPMRDPSFPKSAPLANYIVGLSVYFVTVDENVASLNA